MALDRSFDMGVDVFRDHPPQNYHDNPDDALNLSTVDEDEHVVSFENLKDVALSPSMDPHRITTVQQQQQQQRDLEEANAEGHWTNNRNNSPIKPKRRHTNALMSSSHSHGRRGILCNTGWAACRAGCSPRTKIVGAVVGVLVVVVLALSAHHAGSSDNNNSNAAAAQQQAQEQAALQLRTTLATVTPETLLTDPNSLQNRAYEWLLAEQDHDDKDDGTHESDNDDTDSAKSTVLLERYAVVVLDLHLRGEGSANTVAQAGISTCEWSGVTCHNDTGLVQSIVWAGQGLSGSLPNELKALRTSLTKLDLAENQLFGALPEGLFDCEPLQYLYLHDNLLTGRLSHRFARLPHLVHLYLGQNHFHGNLPAELGDLPRVRPKTGEVNLWVRPLRYLNLHHNRLSGEIPQNVTFKKMYYMDLSYNHLSGPLPSIWSDDQEHPMHFIRHLFLNHNQFNGSIPERYPSMGNGRMESFHVGDNQLTGKVPDNYNPVRFMESLELHRNNFTEPLGEKLCGLIVFLPPASELTNLKADCSVCDCDYFCEPGYCYDDGNQKEVAVVVEDENGGNSTNVNDVVEDENSTGNSTDVNEVVDDSNGGN